MQFTTILALASLSALIFASPIAVTSDSVYSPLVKRTAIPDNQLYTYVGCYQDDVHRALPNGLNIGDQGTLENMITICHGIANSENAQYFALSFGVYCYYAMNDDFKLHGANNGGCNSPCGNSVSPNAAMCGGAMINSVFQIGQPTASLDNARYKAATSVYKTYLYRGCYNDAATARILPTLYVIPGSNRFGIEVVRACYNKALSVAGTTYFGLRDGVNCYYGADSDPLTKLVTSAISSDNQCSRDCGQTADDDLTSVQVKCGGNNHMSVYQLMK